MAGKHPIKKNSSVPKLQFNQQGQLTHFLKIADLTQDQLYTLLDIAESFLSDDRKSARKVPLLRGKTVSNLFFEPSTRTRSTFELAAKRLSADVLNFYIDTTAVKKGESSLDTLKNIHAMGVELFVIRHPDSGAAEFIAEKMGDKICVINAGDGRHAHPTQALLDMLTIRTIKKDFSKLTVALVGDILHSRVARSEIKALQTLGVKQIRIITPRTLVPAGIEDMNVQVFQNIRAGFQDADVVIILRLQKERMQGSFLPSEREYYQCYGVTTECLQQAKPDAIVLHPGPINRGVEISSEVADGEQSAILKQVSFGIATRMAIMSLIMGNRTQANENIN